MALVGEKIADEYNIPARMRVEMFLNRRNREKAAREFLCRFGNSRRNRVVLQSETDKTGRQGRFDYVLNGGPKRLDIIRGVQM
jgi:hypothetical protein